MANIEEMTPSLQKKMYEGRDLINKLKQNKYSPLSPEEIIRKFSSDIKAPGE